MILPDTLSLKTVVNICNGFVVKLTEYRSQLVASNNSTDDELNYIESQVIFYFRKLQGYQAAYPTYNISPLHASYYKGLLNLIQSKRKFNKRHQAILYPPEFVFPRNPSLRDWIEPQDVSEIYNEDGTGLTFESGPAGRLNVIRTRYAPYLEKKYYDFIDKKWTKPMIEMVIDQGTSPIDITSYFTNSIISIPEDAHGINDDIYYFFDGEKLITNYDFTNIEDRKLITIKYKKLVDALRVKAVLRSNTSAISPYTPSVDQYTLLVDKQRIFG